MSDICVGRSDCGDRANDDALDEEEEKVIRSLLLAEINHSPSSSSSASPHSALLELQAKRCAVVLQDAYIEATSSSSSFSLFQNDNTSSKNKTNELMHRQLVKHAMSKRGFAVTTLMTRGGDTHDNDDGFSNMDLALGALLARRLTTTMTFKPTPTPTPTPTSVSAISRDTDFSHSDYFDTENTTTTTTTTTTTNPDTTKYNDWLGDDTHKIGEGGFGQVFVHKHNTNLAVKRSKHATQSHIWDKEHNALTHIHNALKHLTPTLSRVFLIPVYEYKQHPNMFCEMVMGRVEYKQPLPLIPGANPEATIQSMFGWENASMEQTGRGHFVGRAQLKEYLFSLRDQDEYDAVVRELGVIMAWIHYVACHTAFDMEIFVGTITPPPTATTTLTTAASTSTTSTTTTQPTKPCFYIADFDQSTFITNHENNIQNMEWALSALEYFPIPEMTEEYEIFKTSYLSTAAEAGYEAVATQVMRRYEHANSI